jgi:glycosyltransferase involved in cell wall biosynthesis
MARIKISLIFTIFNEVKSLPKLMASIAAQTRLPDEIIICDAGSTDGSLEFLATYAKQATIPLRVIVEKGANISRGRNVAISAAAYDIIAVTDGGCELDPHWLEHILAPLTHEVDVVYGRTRSVGYSLVGREYAALYDIKTHTDDLNEAELSSRTVIFRKKAWEQANGYPEHLTLAGEDTLFFLELAKQAKAAYAKNAIVTWYHGAETLKKVYKVHKRNSIGSGEADMFSRQYAMLTGVYILIALVIIIGLLSPWLMLGGLALLAAICSRETVAVWRASRRLSTIFILPAVMVMRDFGMMLGFMIGTSRRLRKKAHA